jgi:hypothetical protein
VAVVHHQGFAPEVHIDHSFVQQNREEVGLPPDNRDPGIRF